MNRVEFEKYVEENYRSKKDYPWSKYPNFAVFRHGNQKCFAIIMTLPKSKIGMSGEGFVDVVNLKSDPIMLGSLLLNPSIFPAYHMNKEHWFTAALDGSINDDEIKMLVDVSFEKTSPRRIKECAADTCLTAPF